MMFKQSPFITDGGGPTSALIKLILNNRRMYIKILYVMRTTVSGLIPISGLRGTIRCHFFALSEYKAAAAARPDAQTNVGNFILIYWLICVCARFKPVSDEIHDHRVMNALLLRKQLINCSNAATHS